MQSQKNGEEYLNSKDRQHKKRKSVIVTIALGIVLTVIIAFFSAEIVIEQYKEDMAQGLSDVVKQYEDNIERDALYAQSVVETGDALTRCLCHYINIHGQSEPVMEELRKETQKYLDFYVFNGTVDDEAKEARGFFHKQADNRFEDYSKEELYDIFAESNSVFDNGDYYICAEAFSGGYVITVFGAEKIFVEKSALEAYSESSDEKIARIDVNTGIIEDSNVNSDIGKAAEEIAYFNFEGEFIPESAGLTRSENGAVLIKAVSERVEDEVFVSVIPMEILVPTIVRNSIIGIVLCWCFLFIILMYVLKFERNIYLDDEVEFVQFLDKYYIDSHFLSHVGGLTLLATVLIVLSMLYVQTMASYSTQNVDAKEDLHGLAQHIETNEINAEQMEDDCIKSARVVMNMITEYYACNQEELSNGSLSDFMSYLPQVKRITLYDGSGVSEYDTEGFTGIMLSKDTSSGEGDFWKVIRGESDCEYYNNSDESSLYYISAMRQDCPGIIRMAVYLNYLDEFNANANVQNYIKTANMGASERGYILKDDPDVIYWIREGKNRFKEYTNNLSSNVLTSGYSGIVRIRDVRQLVNVLSTDDMYLICGRATSYFASSDNIVEYLLVALLMFLQYLFFFGTGLKKKEFIDSSDSYQVRKTPTIEEIIRDRTLDSTYRHNSVGMLLLTFVMIVVTLLIDRFFGYTSILSYLFGSKWSKGLNMFSLTMIIILITTVIICGKVLEKLVLLFTKNTGPRGITIGRMTGSIIKFAALIVAIIVTLVDLGANLNALLASAGIAGALLSFCANQTINDMLSGFLMVFENTINVGDWICVDDFRGEVIEIGVRITKVSVGGATMIVNNSDMRTFTKMSKDKSGAFCTVDIAYSENAENVLKILNDRKEYIAQQLPELSEGPYFDGVHELGASGVTLRIWALCHRDNVRHVERQLLKFTKEILDENGIEIPFNQVTIHTADD